MEKYLQEFVDLEKRKYARIGAVFCAPFGDEKVRFNNHGFNHLIRKGRKYRDGSVIIERFGLLPYAIRVLKEVKGTFIYKSNIEGKSIAHFWEIRGEVNFQGNSITICIILRKRNNGHLHFFSVFKKK